MLLRIASREDVAFAALVDLLERIGRAVRAPQALLGANSISWDQRFRNQLPGDR
jgi:hypothetical protein